MELRPYQNEAVNAVYEHLRMRSDNPCVVLPTGCHAKDHPILMYDGRIKKVQDVRVGDVVMGADSKPRHVLALAHGWEKMARVTPVKGEPFIVNMNHILSLVSTNEGKGLYPSQQKGGEITNITVHEYMTKSKSWKHVRKLYRVPVEFKESKNLPIPPHILGLLLGDGTMVDSVGLTSADEELGDEFIRYAESANCSVRVAENDKGVPTYYAIKGEETEVNSLIEMLFAMGLYGHRSQNKFIPHEYLTASRTDRLHLLAGLLDSDGFFDCHCMEITTKSCELSGDIVFLARSLGFMANCVEKYCACQTGAGGWYYRINISGDLSQLPCRRKRHVFKVREQKKNVLRTGFTVEELPEDGFYGFELDSDHLYVDGNFIVHHNTGKSIVIAKIASDAVMQWQGRVLILAHVKELLEQNADKIQKLCPALQVGVFSAGLKSRDTKESVIVAGIQSVYDKACDLWKFDLVIIDEAHLIPGDGEGMYRSFLKDMAVINPNVRLIGLTATPYRLKGGLICKPENLLNEVCYEAGLKEMIHNGYLSPLVSKAGRAEAKLGDLHIRGGEFMADEIEKAMDNTELVTAACREIVDLTLDRKSVLIFTSSVDHCKHVAEAITRFSQQECAIVTGNTNADDRNTIIERFKGAAVKKDFFNYYSPLKFLANVNVLTTGFDAPNADCIVLLRPTNSAGLLVQMIGRGTRLSPATGKVNCLILDYGENILRHGPVDMIKIKEKSGDKGVSVAPAKKCPKCQSVFHASYMKCPDCGYEFPPPAFHHNTTASSEGVLSGQSSVTTLKVKDVYFAPHRKRNAKEGDPSTVRVDYFCGVGEIKSEWICPEHVGFARNKFEKWWSERAPAGCTFPKNAAETVNLANSGILADTLEITVRTITGDPFERITDYKLGEKKLISEDEIKFADADEYQSYEDVPIENDFVAQNEAKSVKMSGIYNSNRNEFNAMEKRIIARFGFEVSDDDIPF